MPKHAVVIGAGLGGLAAACLLANEGIDVSVYEKNCTAGGKMQQIERNGYRFDTGPSLLTMPFLLQKLFEKCGEHLNDFLEISELNPLCHYFYPDGVIFDNYADRTQNAREIAKFAPEEIENYEAFLARSEKIYRRTADAFLFNPLYDLKDFSRLNFFNFLGIDAFSTVSKKVDSHFSSPHLRQFFKRFTTYNGSSPFEAPATLNVIPHVELNQGGFYVKGGLYQIAHSLVELAKRLGVTFHFNQAAASINISGRKVNGIQLKNGKKVVADYIFANSDATDTLTNLIPDDAIPPQKKSKQQKVEPSGSGFVMLLGCRKKWDRLKHHNIFFSDDYRKEFDDIFKEKRLPDNPTIYIANTSYSDPGHAPQGSSNLFVLINAPYVDKHQNWNTMKDEYSSFIISELEKRGLAELEASLEFVETITPADFLEKYRSNRGAIYGTSSNNKLAAFARPRNKIRFLENLYLVGGSTHPGGGIPLVIQSAFNAIELLERTDRT